MPSRVPHTTFFTISPEMRASLPTTILFEPFGRLLRMKVAYADVNFTMSKGLSVSPAGPPIVPRIPDIDFISDIV